MKICPSCGKEFNSKTMKCPDCQEIFRSNADKNDFGYSSEAPANEKGYQTLQKTRWMKKSITIAIAIAILIIGGLIYQILQARSWDLYTTANGLPSDRITSLALSPDGKLWAGTTGGIAYLNGEQWIKLGGYIPSLPVKQIEYTSDGLLIVVFREIDTGQLGQRYTFYRYDGSSWQLTTIFEVDQYGTGRIIIAAGDRICINRQKSISCYDGNTWTNYLSIDGYVDDWVSRPIEFAVDGTLWVSAIEGLSHFDGETWKIFTVADGLPHNHVSRIEITPNGDVWVKTNSGFSRFDGEKWRNYTTADGLAYDEVVYLEVSPDGTLWVITSRTPGQYNNLSYFDGEKWITFYLGEKRAPAGFYLTFFTGKVLHYINDGTLYRFEDGELIDLEPVKNGIPKKVISSSEIPLIVKDGRIWLGTREGLFSYLPQNAVPAWIHSIWLSLRLVLIVAVPVLLLSIWKEKRKVQIMEKRKIGRIFLAAIGSGILGTALGGFVQLFFYDFVAPFVVFLSPFGILHLFAGAIIGALTAMFLEFTSVKPKAIEAAALSTILAFIVGFFFLGVIFSIT